MEIAKETPQKKIKKIKIVSSSLSQSMEDMIGNCFTNGKVAHIT